MKGQQDRRELFQDRIIRWGVTIALAVYLLFAHPCHGDEDTELFTRFWIG